MPYISNKTSEKIKNVLTELTQEEKDAIYRTLWKEHVEEDIASYAENNNIEVSDETISKLADLYVFEGKYDCNNAYWDNIQNLIKEYN